MGFILLFPVKILKIAGIILGDLILLGWDLFCRHFISKLVVRAQKAGVIALRDLILSGRDSFLVDFIVNWLEFS